jgi:hypothetical protein
MSKSESSKMPDSVRQELLSVRFLGATNMFHWKAVVEIAKQCGFTDLAEWLPGNVKLYCHFILTGETEL